MLWRHVSNYYRMTHIVHSAVYAVATCLRFCMDLGGQEIVWNFEFFCTEWTARPNCVETGNPLSALERQLPEARACGYISLYQARKAYDCANCGVGLPKMDVFPVTGATSFFVGFCYSQQLSASCGAFLSRYAPVRRTGTFFSRAEDNFFKKISLRHAARGLF